MLLEQGVPSTWEGFIRWNEEKGTCDMIPVFWNQSRRLWTIKYSTGASASQARTAYDSACNMEEIPDNDEEFTANPSINSAFAMTLADDGMIVVKPTPRGREKRLTAFARHRKMGHVGKCDCPVCKKLYTNLTRVNSKDNPTVDHHHVGGK